MFRTTCLLIPLLLTLSACGAGIVGGIIAGNENRGSSPTPNVTVPAINFPAGSVPIGVERTPEPRRVLIQNVSVDNVQSLSVQIEAAGATDEQLNPSIVSITPGADGGAAGASATVQFDLDLGKIQAAVSDLTAADLIAKIYVKFNGEDAAPPGDLLIRKQAVITLVAPSAPLELEPDGTTSVRVRVSGLVATGTDLTMAVSIPQPPVVADFNNLVREDIPGSDDFFLTGTAPSNNIPSAAVFGVESAESGVSTLISALYRPQIDTVFPPAGPVAGGTLVRAIGLAMVPAKAAPPFLDFDRVTILLRKRGREVQVPRSDIRENESSLNQISFRVPPSPDGLPGPVEILLRLDIDGGGVVEELAAGLYRYGFPQVAYGPRGAVIEDGTIDVALAPILAPGAQVDDLAVLRQEAGIGLVQLFGGHGNGMFRTVGAPFLVGGTGQIQRQNPQGLLAGDFDGEGDTDLLVLNAGVSGTASHVVVPTQSAPMPPLGEPFGTALTPGDLVHGVTGDLNGDGMDDTVLFPSAQQQDTRPFVMLSGGPAGLAPSGRLQLPAAIYQAARLIDLDQDGDLDLLALAGGTSPRLVTAAGDGNGALSLQQDLLLAIPGYAPVLDSLAVGVHAVAGGVEPDIALVFSGELGAPATPPVVAVVRSTGLGELSYQQPDPQRTRTLVTTTTLVSSAGTDVDGDGVAELAVGLGGQDITPIRLMVRDTAGAYVEVPGAVERGAELPVEVQHVRWTTTSAATGLAVTHQVAVDSAIESRVSVYLAESAPLRLRSPDSGFEVPERIRGVAVGSFGGAGVLFAVRPGQIQPLFDTATGLELGPTLSVPDVVTGTVRAVRLSANSQDRRDGLMWLEDNPVTLRLVVLEPSTNAIVSSPDLRLLLPPNLRARPVSGDSPVAVGDVNGDGFDDVLVALRFLGIPDPDEDDAVLALFFGVGVGGGFPFDSPSRVALTHGRVSAVALGDLVPETSGSRLLEVAAAVPESSFANPVDGNHVRFYRLEEDVLQRSFATGGATALIAGSGPSRLAIADLDRNNTQDLVVASRDGRLRSFVSTGQLASNPAEVNIDDFQESLTSPQQLAPGVPEAMIRQDMNGDGLADLVVAVVESTPSGISHSVALYLAANVGGLDGPFFVPRTRTGDLQNGVLRDAAFFLDVADLNVDGLPDLVVGWDSTGAGDRNLRVLFGQGR